MSQTYEGGPISVNAVGTTLTTSASSTSATIPNDSAGNIPRYVRVSATAAAYVKLGVSAATATGNDMLVQPADAVILHIPSGITKIAAIQDTAAGKVNVVPLDNV
jgi:hypothetical protein